MSKEMMHRALQQLQDEAEIKDAELARLREENDRLAALAYSETKLLQEVKRLTALIKEARANAKKQLDKHKKPSGRTMHGGVCFCQICNDNRDWLNKAGWGGGDLT